MTGETGARGNFRLVVLRSEAGHIKAALRGGWKVLWK